MKLLKLTIAVGVILASGSAFADPRISGTLKAQLIADSNTRTATNLTTNVSNTSKENRPFLFGDSRIKFSGSEKFGKDKELTASYSLEYNISTDNDVDLFTARSVYASLDHKTYGRIRYGRMTTPETDFDIAVSQSYVWGGALPFGGFAPRHNNALQYYSPYFGKDKGTRVKLHYGMDENNRTDNRVTTFINGSSTNLRRDMAVAQILHNDQTWGWGASYSQAGSDFKALTGMVRYTKDQQWNTAMTLRTADFNSGSNEVGILLASTYKMAGFKDAQLYGQLAHTQNFRGRKDNIITNGVIGVSKDIRAGSNRLSIFAEMGGGQQKSNATNSSGQPVKDKTSVFGVGVGANYKF